MKRRCVVCRVADDLQNGAFCIDGRTCNYRFDILVRHGREGAMPMSPLQVAAWSSVW